jgi:hypothetical protein
MGPQAESSARFLRPSCLRSPRQFGEVGQIAERGDGFGLGDERPDAQGIEEAEVFGVLGRLRESEDLVLLVKLQAAVGFEAFLLEVVILEELTDALAWRTWGQAVTVS